MKCQSPFSQRSKNKITYLFSLNVVVSTVRVKRHSTIQKKTGLIIFCKLSPQGTIHIKCCPIFSKKKNQNKTAYLSFAYYVIGMLKVKKYSTIEKLQLYALDKIISQLYYLLIFVISVIWVKRYSTILRRQSLTFHVNCLHRRLFTWNSSPIFSEENKRSSNFVISVLKVKSFSTILRN